MITNKPDTDYEFHVGDRVRVVREFFHYDPVEVGSKGVVFSPYTDWNGQPFILRTSHATANGGGHDIHVRLDNGREIKARVEGTTTYIVKA